MPKYSRSFQEAKNTRADVIFGSKVSMAPMETKALLDLARNGPPSPGVMGKKLYYCQVFSLI